MNRITVNGNRITNNFNYKITNNKINIKNIEELEIIYNQATIKLEINIYSNCKIFEYIDNSNIDNIYNLNSDLIINRFSLNSTIKTIINMNKENSDLKYFYGTINIDDNNYTIDINHNNKNTKSYILNHGINYKSSKLDFLINGNIPKYSDGAETTQDSKIMLIENNNCSIKPNLLVDNDDISANHASYIGSFDENKLFYLASRGINHQQSIRILVKAFLLGNTNLNFLQREMIINIINEYWR